MNRNLTKYRKNTAVLGLLITLVMIGLSGRLGFLMIGQGTHYSQMAEELHQRERWVKAARGRILDRRGEVLADNRTVCTVSVIHNQIGDPGTVISLLSQMLDLDQEGLRKKVEKRSAREIIKVNVDQETGNRIRALNLPGVKVDEDSRRHYPMGSLASHVLGFTGGDNQGVIGLEVEYESVLKGRNGAILTMTDARGVELEGEGEERVDPVPGMDLHLTLDSTIQQYAEQLAETVLEEKNALRVSLIVMNPQDGGILAMASVPEFDLNDPFTPDQNLGSERLRQEAAARGEVSGKKRQELLNGMWRNPCISDTYEPGSTFKIITAAAGLEAGAVTLEDRFSCPGFRIVEDRKIRCHKTQGHGGESFLDGVKNSCNPVFIDVGQRLGAERYYEFFSHFGLLGKTGVDLPGEAATIMHKKDRIGPVELATISFGQSFQITPIQLAATVSSLVNGGKRVTPHFGDFVTDHQGENVRKLEYPVGEQVLSEETSRTLRYVLKEVVESGSGKNARVEGFSIGGKTATSEKLPRSRKKYISSFLGFAPAEDPQILALITIDEPEGIYYGGTIAAPVIGKFFRNIRPYYQN